MTPEQRELVHALVVTPPGISIRKITKDEFALDFPTALDGDQLSFDVLNDAYYNRDAADLRCALIIGHVFGFSAKHKDLLCRLTSEE
jgi:hypothetical protein